MLHYPALPAEVSRVIASVLPVYDAYEKWATSVQRMTEGGGPDVSDKPVIEMSGCLTDVGIVLAAYRSGNKLLPPVVLPTIPDPPAEFDGAA